MKKCYKCKELKDNDKFYKNKITPSGLSGYCKECTHALERKNIELVKEWLQILKTQCSKCNESRWWCLDFHHTDPDIKTIDIARYAVSGTSSVETKKKRILKELETCIILCSNCHRDFHYQEKTGMYKLNKRKNKNK